MGKKSAELAVAGELQRADALGIVSVVIAIVVGIACVVCVATAFANTVLLAPPPPPPPPAPPPFLAFLVSASTREWWYQNVCALCVVLGGYA